MQELLRDHVALVAVPVQHDKEGRPLVARAWVYDTCAILVDLILIRVHAVAGEAADNVGGQRQVFGLILLAHLHRLVEARDRRRRPRGSLRKRHRRHGIGRHGIGGCEHGALGLKQ